MTKLIECLRTGNKTLNNGGAVMIAKIPMRKNKEGDQIGTYVVEAVGYTEDDIDAGSLRVNCMVVRPDRLIDVPEDVEEDGWFGDGHIKRTRVPMYIAVGMTTYYHAHHNVYETKKR